MPRPSCRLHSNNPHRGRSTSLGESFIPTSPQLSLTPLIHVPAYLQTPLEQSVPRPLPAHAEAKTLNAPSITFKIRHIQISCHEPAGRTVVAMGFPTRRRARPLQARSQETRGTRFLLEARACPCPVERCRRLPCSAPWVGVPVPASSCHADGPAESAPVDGRRRTLDCEEDLAARGTRGETACICWGIAGGKLPWVIDGRPRHRDRRRHRLQGEGSRRRQCSLVRPGRVMYSVARDRDLNASARQGLLGWEEPGQGRDVAGGAWSR